MASTPIIGPVYGLSSGAVCPAAAPLEGSFARVALADEGGGGVSDDVRDGASLEAPGGASPRQPLDHAKAPATPAATKNPSALANTVAPVPEAGADARVSARSSLRRTRVFCPVAFGCAPLRGVDVRLMAGGAVLRGSVESSGRAGGFEGLSTWWLTCRSSSLRDSAPRGERNACQVPAGMTVTSALLGSSRAVFRKPRVRKTARLERLR
jgi:hypothetical protein